MVDALTLRVRTRFDVPAPASAELDRGLKDVTTSSVEAFRYYAEGINLQLRYQQEEAITLLEKALELDPGFATALSKLAAIHSNLGHDRESLEYARRALEHLDRLSARERYYVEGTYYFRRRETYDRAIEAFRKAVELYPDHAAAQNNLALIYLDLERFEKRSRKARSSSDVDTSTCPSTTSSPWRTRLAGISKRDTGCSRPSSSVIRRTGRATLSSAGTSSAGENWTSPWPPSRKRIP
jgi:Flp pilus assembly protein TadD